MHKSKQHFYVTRESQRSKAPSSRKESYVGIRDLTDLDKIKETDIISYRGTIRGIKNRVRAGLANFENPAALRNVSIVSTTIDSIYPRMVQPWEGLTLLHLNGFAAVSARQLWP